MTFQADWSGRGVEEYYQKFLELQDRLRKSEEERLQLEMKFNTMIQVTQEEEQLHYKRLKTQYKRFMEENRRRQERNQQLLQMLERVESRAAMFEAKSKRFKLLRHQYHSFLHRVESERRLEGREMVAKGMTGMAGPTLGALIDQRLPRAVETFGAAPMPQSGALQATHDLGTADQLLSRLKEQSNEAPIADGIKRSIHERRRRRIDLNTRRVTIEDDTDDSTTSAAGRGAGVEDVPKLRNGHLPNGKAQAQCAHYNSSEPLNGVEVINNNGDVNDSKVVDEVKLKERYESAAYTKDVDVTQQNGGEVTSIESYNNEISGEEVKEVALSPEIATKEKMTVQITDSQEYDLSTYENGILENANVQGQMDEPSRGELTLKDTSKVELQQGQINREEKEFDQSELGENEQSLHDEQKHDQQVYQQQQPDPITKSFNEDFHNQPEMNSQLEENAGNQLIHQDLNLKQSYKETNLGQNYKGSNVEPEQDFQSSLPTSNLNSEQVYGDNGDASMINIDPSDSYQDPTLLRGTSDVQYDESNQPIQYDTNGQPIYYDDNGQPMHYNANTQEYTYSEQQYAESEQAGNYDQNYPHYQHQQGPENVYYDENGQPITYSQQEGEQCEPHEGEQNVNFEHNLNAMVLTEEGGAYYEENGQLYDQQQDGHEGTEGEQGAYMENLCAEVQPVQDAEHMEQDLQLHEGAAAEDCAPQVASYEGEVEDGRQHVGNVEVIPGVKANVMELLDTESESTHNRQGDSKGANESDFDFSSTSDAKA